MDKIIVASMRKSAGKTSLIMGLIQAMAQQKTIGYMKPFGDRLLYRKKRLWDYDSALIANVFGLKEAPENITIAFEHSKIRYMYDKESTKKKVLDMVAKTGQEKDILFIEGGKDLTYGTSVYLDPVSVTRYVDGKLILVMSGSDDAVVDDITFMKPYIQMTGVNLAGVIINKVHDTKEFSDLYMERITEMDIPVLGVIPYETELSYLSVGYLSEFLFAKVLAGENALNNVVKNIFVGALSANVALRNPLFAKEAKLIITGGDRVDMILAALESDTAGIILTNNVLPPSGIISKAANRNIPLLLVSADTFQTANQIYNLEPLPTKEDTEKIEILGKAIAEHVSIDAL
ncbi:MAG: AAA family ATPase [Theionarchaea archaeon]|nr:AAA family ATPase [Theionarchaea archaeon]